MFGIILGNPYIPEVAKVRQIVKNAIRRSQRKCFEVYFGALTEEKLANFDLVLTHHSRSTCTST